MTAGETSMRSDASFHRVLYSHSHGSFGPRLGRTDVRKPSGSEVKIDTPGFLTSTSRGIIPHLTQDHVGRTKAIRWLHVPFETFLERTPPIPTLIGGEKPLQALIGLQDNAHVLSMSLRDPLDDREMPPNGSKFVTANCIRGVRMISPDQYRSLLHTCNPDIAIALSDIPFTPPPFSQKRVTKSLERSAAWLASILQPIPGIVDGRHHPSNILVQLVGDVNIAARKAFSNSLMETLVGKEAEQVKPFKCLNDGVMGYTFDLIPLRASLLASDQSTLELDKAELSELPNRRAINTKPLTQPCSETLLPQIVDLLRASLDPLTPEKPRLATGASSPHEVLYLVRDIGIDLFDVAWVQKAADWGIALDFVFPVPREGVPGGNVREDGKRDIGHNVYSEQYRKEFIRLADSYEDGASQTQNSTHVCPCIACSPVSPHTELVHASIDVLMRSPAPDSDSPDPSSVYDPPFTRAYIHHLLHTHEMSAHALLAAHNLAIADAFFASVRDVLALGAPHLHHPHAHSHGSYHTDVHPETESLVTASDDANFALFVKEVERFCNTYDGTLRIFGEAKRNWITVDYARGKGRLAREKAKQGEDDLTTKAETVAEVDETAV